MPFDFEWLIADKTRHFAGRDWVFSEIDRWLADPAPPFFIVTGGPGVGKTAIAARLAQFSSGAASASPFPCLKPGFLAHIHFCHVPHVATLDPVRFVEALSESLASQDEDFARTLLGLTQGDLPVLPSFAPAADGVHATRLDVRNLHGGTDSAQTLFDRLVLRPLERVAAERAARSVVILVDAIDEALAFRAESNIADLIASLRLPPSVRFLLTSRLGPHLTRFPTARLLSLDDNPEKLAADLQAYGSFYLSAQTEGLAPSGIVERLWVWERIDRWLAEEGPAQFLLSGAPGSGKSTLMRRLEAPAPIERSGALVRPANTWSHLHICSAGDDTSLDAIHFVERLAIALARKYPEYAEALARIDPAIKIDAAAIVQHAAAGAQVTAVSIGTLAIGERNPRVAFEHVLRRPLEQLCSSSFRDTILIGVDALNEAQGYASNALATAIAHVGRPEAKWPRMVRWLLTSTPDPRIIHLFGHPALDLVDNAPDDRDVLAYAYGRLRVLGDTDRATLARRVSEAAKGIFLYARYALDAAEDQVRQGRSWKDLELPAGLNEQYRTFLRRELAAGLQTWQQDYRPLLGCLAVSQGNGLTRTQLAGILRRDADALAPLLTACGQYLQDAGANGPLRLYHQSFREFLEDDGEFGIDLSDAHRRIGAYFVQAYAGEWREAEDHYALQHTAIHLIEAIRQLPASAEPLARRELAGWMRTLALDAGYWDARRRSLAGDELTIAPALRLLLEIWATPRLAREVTMPLLGLLAVAREPLTREQLARVSGIDAASLLDGLRLLGAGVAGDEVAGFRLTDERLAAHLAQYVDDGLAGQHRRLADGFLRPDGQNWMECDRYGLRWIITHLVGARGWPQLASAVGDGEFWSARLAREGLPAAVEDLLAARELAPATGTLRVGLNDLLVTIRRLATAPADSREAAPVRMAQAIVSRVREIGLDHPQSEVSTIPLTADLVKTLVARSHGNILYMRLVLQEIERNPAHAATVMREVPTDLAGWYRSSLQRVMGNEGPNGWQLYRPVLAVLAVAREAITESQLSTLTGIPSSTLESVLHRLGGFLTTIQGIERRYSLYHASLRDFLADPEQSHEFWIDPGRAHLSIADYYDTDRWAESDDYGMRYLVGHLESAVLGASQPQAHALVERMVSIAFDPRFQHLHTERLNDPVVLAGDLVRTLDAAVRDDHVNAPPLVATAARGWTAFRRQALRPEVLFEYARQGRAREALHYLAQYNIDAEWRAAVQWLVAWLAADREAEVAATLTKELGAIGTGDGTLGTLASRVLDAIGGAASVLRPLPLAPPPEVVAALTGSDPPSSLMLIDSLGLSAGADESIYLVDLNGPLLVSYAASYPQEGREHLRRYVDKVGANAYSFNRRRTYWRLLDSVLRHPDAGWTREAAVDVVIAALVETDIHFEEGLPITVLALQARAGSPGARERLDQRLHDAVLEARAAEESTRFDQWSHRRRRLAALAQSYAVAIGDHDVAIEVMDEARRLSRGFAGFEATAQLELGATMIACGFDEADTREVERASVAAAQNIQDGTFAVRVLARCQAVAHDWRAEEPDLTRLVAAFARDPHGARFAALHTIGGEFDTRSLSALPVPDQIRLSRTLRATAQIFDQPLSTLSAFNPEYDPDSPLEIGTIVRIPDPALAPPLAARLSAIVLAESRLSGTERAQLIQQLVPPAVGTATELDAVLSRLLLAAAPDDIESLARLVR